VKKLTKLQLNLVAICLAILCLVVIGIGIHEVESQNDTVAGVTKMAGYFEAHKTKAFTLSDAAHKELLSHAVGMGGGSRKAGGPKHK